MLTTKQIDALDKCVQGIEILHEHDLIIDNPVELQAREAIEQLKREQQEEVDEELRALVGSTYKEPSIEQPYTPTMRAIDRLLWDRYQEPHWKLQQKHRTVERVRQRAYAKIDASDK